MKFKLILFLNEVKNEWTCASAPPRCLHFVGKTTLPLPLPLSVLLPLPSVSFKSAYLLGKPFIIVTLNFYFYLFIFFVAVPFEG